MRGAIALLVTVVALVAGGCGGGDGGGDDEPLSKEDYVAQMQTIGRELNASLESLGTVSSLEQSVTVLRGAQDELGAAADEMEALAAPEDVETEHEALAGAVHDLSDQLGGLADRIESGDTEQLSDVLEELQSLDGLQGVVSAAEAVSAKGYAIGS